MRDIGINEDFILSEFLKLDRYHEETKPTPDVILSLEFAAELILRLPSIILVYFSIII